MDYRCLWTQGLLRMKDTRFHVVVNRNVTIKVKVKVKESHYRPGQAQRVLRKLRFPDYVTVAQDCGKVVSFTHRPPLPPGNTPGTHFC